MKKSPLSLIIFASLSLTMTACSSSRGGNNDYANTSEYVTEKPKTNTVTNELTQVQPSNHAENTANINVDSPFKQNVFVQPEDGTLTGAVIHIDSKGNSQSYNPVNNGKEALNELIINDQRIILFSSSDLISGNGLDGFKVLTNKDVAQETPINGTVKGLVGGFGSQASYNPTEFRNMRFGAVNINDKSYLFVQGLLTPTSLQDSIYPVPRNGKFLYHKGYALYGSLGNYQQLGADVVADFNNKKVQVVLKDGEQQKLAFNADIDGNVFKGITNGIETQGAFYGSLAAEVGGVFYQTEGVDKGKNGVFGAVDKRVIRE
ncbi:transferrin-binding protein-like solute binding protein [Ursidibacter sp. B-7004-1]